MALVTSRKSDLTVVAGETLSIAAVIGNGKQPSFLGLK
jgi:hypothetical protein